MLYTDLRTRFTNKYGGGIKDPILTTLLDTIDSFQNEVRDKLLLSGYSSWSNEISDGFFEVLRKNLFGNMFPGPVYTVAEADLRNVQTADPVKLEANTHFILQDMQGNNNLFTPQLPVWIVPSFDNEVKTESSGENLMLGFKIISNNLKGFDDDNVVSIYASNIDPLILERIRCRIGLLSGYFESNNQFGSVFKESYPEIADIKADFFQTPYTNKFLHIPFSLFKKYGQNIKSDDRIWIPIPGLRKYASELSKRLILNSFPMWNIVFKERLLTRQKDFSRFKLNELNQDINETQITEVYDMGDNPPISYISTNSVMDPAYPYQYSAFPDRNTDSILLSLTPTPVGDIKVKFFQYDLSELCLDIPEGKTLVLFQGMDTRLKSVHTLVKTSRNEILADKKRIWEYFRDMVASRNRWLTKDDLRSAITSYSPFANMKNMFDGERIKIVEKVGRVRGFLSPYTEITVPVRGDESMNETDKNYFERELGLYLKKRTVSGNYLKVKLVLTD